MTEFKLPLHVEVKFDNGPIYVVDANAEEVACFQRSSNPEIDVVLAQHFVALYKHAMQLLRLKKQ